MTTFTMKAGASVELLGPDDLADGLAPLLDAIRSGTARPTVIRRGHTFTTDGAGNLAETSAGGDAFRVPPGTRAIIERIVVTTNTATPAAPVTAGWISFWRSGAEPSALIDFLPQPGQTQVAPGRIVNGGGAYELASGEWLKITAGGLVANTQFYVSLQIMLFDQPGPVPTVQEA